MSGHALRAIACDVLVLGAGIAAYQAAIAARQAGAKVCLAGRAKGASPYILGFNVALPEAGDSWQDHARDTLAGGYMLGQPALVSAMCSEAEATFRELAQWGVPFDTAGAAPALRHLSGSRRPRSVFVREGTGLAIHKALVRRADALGVQQCPGLRVLGLLGEGEVAGALAVDPQGRPFAFHAASTVLAMGGLGGLYGGSTYPADVHGDSYALALEAGADLVDMEFVQFEPTVLCWPDAVSGMEMPTAMLGDGAIMTNRLGERFMCRYNPGDCEKQIEKARMALCIQSEIDAGRGTDHGGVWFDARHLDRRLIEGYVTHHRRLLSAGVDISQQPVHVRPAAHSLMGGVRVDPNFQSTTSGLFACGEAAGGLHGASRIAGNGASDAVITGRIAGRCAAAAVIRRRSYVAEGGEPQQALAREASEAPRAILQQVRACLSADVGIRRSGAGLQRAGEILDALSQQVSEQASGSPLAWRDAGRAVLVAQSITRSALLRQESRGAHYRTDYPEASHRWAMAQAVHLGHKGEVVVSRLAAA